MRILDNVWVDARDKHRLGAPGSARTHAIVISDTSLILNTYALIQTHLLLNTE